MLNDAQAVGCGDIYPEFFRNDKCPVGRCEEDADDKCYDPDGIGYCVKHWKTNATRWKKERKLWTGWKAQGTALRLDV